MLAHQPPFIGLTRQTLRRRESRQAGYPAMTPRITVALHFARSLAGLPLSSPRDDAGLSGIGELEPKVAG